MFETLKRLYKEGKLPVEKLDVAVFKGWITPIQKTEIIVQ